MTNRDYEGFKVGDCVKIVKRTNEHTFYTVITEVSGNKVFAPWKRRLVDDTKWEVDFFYNNLDLNVAITNVKSITFITDDKEVSNFAIKVLTGNDIDAKNYVEELIKQQDKSIKILT